jgi:hypothetical protein
MQNRKNKDFGNEQIEDNNEKVNTIQDWKIQIHQYHASKK